MKRLFLLYGRFDSRFVEFNVVSRVPLNLLYHIELDFRPACIFPILADNSSAPVSQDVKPLTVVFIQLFFYLPVTAVAATDIFYVVHFLYMSFYSFGTNPFKTLPFVPLKLTNL